MTISIERRNGDNQRTQMESWDRNRRGTNFDTEIIETRNGVRHILALAAWPEAQRIAEALNRRAKRDDPLGEGMSRFGG